MKLTLLTISLICLCLFEAKSQISLTASDFPDSGDALVVSRAVDLQIDYSSTGPDYHWDFSNLSLLSQSPREHSSLSGTPFLINMAYGPFAVTAYRASYYMPFSDLPLNQFGNLLPIQIENVYQYTKKASQRMTLVGYSASISGQDVPIKSDTIETKYVFPLEYGDEYISKGYTNLDLSMFIPAKWVQSRKRSSVVDGWGQITTPYGSFEVLRVQHRIEETDSVEYDGTSFGLDIPVMYEYEWLAKEEKIPVLKVVTTEVMGMETVISIEYKDNEILGNASLTSSDQLVVYPNPAADELVISWKEGHKSAAVYSVDGALVGNFTFEGAVHTLNTSAFKPGIYFLSLNNGAGIVNKSFIKK